MKFIRQGATHKVVLGPAVAVGDGFTPVTTLDISTADEAEAILHDNGTVVDISGYTWAAIATADGYYHLTLQSGISNTVGHLTIVVHDDSLCLPLREDFMVLEEAVYDMLFASSALGYIANAPVNVAQFGGSNGTFASGRPEVNTSHAAGTAWNSGAIGASTLASDAITAAKIASDAITAAKLAADCITAAKIADGAIDAATFAADVDAEILSYLVDDATRIDASALNTHAAITAAGIADAVWDEDLTGHTTADSAGQILGDVATGTPPTAAAIADAVWDEAASGHVTAGSFGKLAADILVDTAEIGAAGAGLTEAGGTGDHLTALATQASVNTIDDLLDTEIAALTTELAKVPKSDGTASWNATALAAIQSECNDALVAYDPPTKAELDAADDAVLAAIAGLNDIAATDIVSGGAITTSGGAVSTVTNLTTKTGFKLASDGLDLVVPPDPSAIPVLGTASIVTLIGWFGAWSLNEVDSDADSVNLRNSADTADLAAYASSDDGTTFVSGEAT